MLPINSRSLSKLMRISWLKRTNGILFLPFTKITLIIIKLEIELSIWTRRLYSLFRSDFAVLSLELNMINLKWFSIIASSEAPIWVIDALTWKEGFVILQIFSISLLIGISFYKFEINHLNPLDGISKLTFLDLNSKRRVLEIFKR